MADLAGMRKQFFDTQRQTSKQDAFRRGQEADDLVQRRFTSLGQAGSGAALGTQLKARQANEELAQKAQQEIGGQELQAEMTAAEAQAVRDFQAGEAEKMRGFTGAESEKGRLFQGGLADKDSALKREFFTQEQANKAREYELAKEQFALDKDTTAFNRRMAELEMNRKQPGMFDSFLGEDMGSKVKGSPFGKVFQTMPAVQLGGGGK